MASQISNDFNASIQSVTHSALDRLIRADNERTAANRTPTQIERTKTYHVLPVSCVYKQNTNFIMQMYKLLYKTLQPNSSHCSPSFLLLKYLLRGYPRLFTVISEHICFSFFSVFTLFSCRFRAVD